jgi:hypothetical protein
VHPDATRRIAASRQKRRGEANEEVTPAESNKDAAIRREHMDKRLYEICTNAARVSESGAAQLAKDFARKPSTALDNASPKGKFPSVVHPSGCSSVVERDLAKVEVEGSNPFTRSKF